MQAEEFDARKHVVRNMAVLLRTNDDSSSGWDKVWSIARVNRCLAVHPSFCAVAVCMHLVQVSTGPEQYCQAAGRNDGLKMFIWLDVWEKSVRQPV